MPRATLPRLHNSLLALLVAGCGLAVTLLGAAPAGSPVGGDAPMLVGTVLQLDATDGARVQTTAEAIPLPALDTPRVARPLARRSRHALALPFFSFFPRG